MTIHGRPDRRKKKAVGGADEQAERQESRDYQRLDYGYNLYTPHAPSRRTLVGGGFTEKQVRQGLSKMRTDSTMKTALLEVVYKRRSPQVVAAEHGFSRAKLDVYASRLREHIRNAPRENSGTDLHIEENLSLHSQCFTYPSVKNPCIEGKGEQEIKWKPEIGSVRQSTTETDAPSKQDIAVST